MHNPFTEVRSHLRLAAAFLTDSGARAVAVKAHIIAFELELDPGRPGTYLAVPELALEEVRKILKSLGPLRGVRQAHANDGKKLVQDQTPVPLPGVEEAIEELKKAIRALEGRRDAWSGS